MAERVVIAEIVIDEKGAVTSIRKLIGEQEKLGKTTKTTGDVFTERMFSMRHAVTALLGAFTLEGAIQRVKQFALEIAKTDTAFQQFTDSVKVANKEVQDFFRPFVHQALIAAAQGINTIGQAFSTFFSTFRSGYDSLGAKGKAAFWTLAALLGGKTGANFAKSMLGMGGETASEAGAGSFIGPIGSVGTKPGERPYSPTSPLGSLANPALAEKVEITLGPVRDFANTVHAANLELESLSHYLETGNGGVGRNDLPSMFEALGDGIEDVTGKVSRSMSVWEGMEQQLTKVNFVFEMMNMAFSSFASILTNAFSGAGANFRQGMTEILKSVSQLAFVYALWNVALGIMASTGFGAAALQGTPAQFFLAAAKFGAVGAAAGLAARVVSHGGAESGGGGSAAGASAAGVGGAPPSGPNYSWSFNIEGNVLSQESFVRDLMLWSKRALADGAAGGSL